MWSNVGGGTVDYVANWFLKASSYSANGGAIPPHIAFVSTNSITQGEQVAQIWNALFEQSMEISFGHQTFKWGSDAKGKAQVHCVIVGLSRRENVQKIKRLFIYENAAAEPIETTCAYLSPYLIDADNLPNRFMVIPSTRNAINSAPKLRTGVQMIDNGILTFTDEEKAEIVKLEPKSAKWLKRFAGGDEYISGDYRWIFYLRNISPSELKSLPLLKSRVAELKKWRLSRTRSATKKLGETPTLVGVDEQPKNDFLVIPNTSSERREYIPMGWLDTSYVANQKLRILPDANIFEFSVLTSAIHMAWMRTITGRMKSDYMYSVGVVYNTFPWPALDDKAKEALTKTGQAILDARAEWPEATLADLYDPDAMPANLRKAHIANDKAVDRLYRKQPFESERERVEHLFMLYEQLQAPLVAASKPKPRKRRPKPIKTS